MERNVKNWLPFYLGYVSECTAREMSILIKCPFEETWSELEKLVDDGRAMSKLYNGEVVYSIRPINDYFKDIIENKREENKNE